MSVAPRVHLVSQHNLDDLVGALRETRRIAVDTEFHAERRFLPELYLVQLHVEGGDTWIVDPRPPTGQPDLLPRLVDALLGVTWVVHAGEQDLRVLSVALGGLPDVILDTQLAAGLATTHWPAPYQGLVEQHLGVRIDKAETLSDWSRRPLTAAQLGYAAVDVQHVLPLWDRLSELLADLGRTETAALACADARRIALDGPDDADAFREIGASAALTPAALLVLQELAAWRMERARATNQPVRAVLNDGVLVDLARRQPITVGSLLSNRRLPKSINKDAEELVHRIARAAGRPEFALPLIVRRRTPEWRRAAWLQLWAECIGERRRFSAGLALPRPLIESLVAAPPIGRDAVRERLGWRDALTGDAIGDALGGTVGLRIFDGDVVCAELDGGGTGAIGAGPGVRKNL